MAVKAVETALPLSLSRKIRTEKAAARPEKVLSPPYLYFKL